MHKLVSKSDRSNEFPFSSSLIRLGMVCVLFLEDRATTVTIVPEIVVK